MLELVAGGAAVGIAQSRQRLQQGLTRHPDPQDRGRDLRHQLRGQVEVLGLDRRVAAGLAAERVEVGRHVAVGAVGLEQRGGRLHRCEQLLAGLGRGHGRSGGDGSGGGRGRVGVGDHGLLDAQRAGNLLVEAVLALQQQLDPPQEGARLGALDDPVVIGRGHRHHLRDAKRLDPLGGGVRPLGRVGDRARGDDRALPRHQPWDRGDRPDPARVGQRDVGALEVIGGEGVLARLGDQVLVVAVEGGEVELLGALDRRHHEAARAVLALDIDGDAEVDRAALDRERLVVADLEGADHHGPLLRCLDDRPGDQMSEGDLHPALLQHSVQRLALGVEGVDRDRPERGGGRDLAALVHRLCEHRRRAAQCLGLPGRRWRRCPVAVGGGEDVLLAHLAAGPGAADQSKVDPVGRRRPPRHGSRLDAVTVSGLRSRLGNHRRGGCPALSALRGPGVAGLTGLHLGKRRADLDHVVDLDQQLGDRPRGGRRDLGVDLVSRDLDHGVAFGDRVALGDVPLEHRPLGHRLAHGRHLDLDSGGLSHSRLSLCDARSRGTASGEGRSTRQAGDHVGLVRDRVEDVADEELAGPPGVTAEATAQLPGGRHRPAQRQRGAALRADDCSVGDHLDPMAGDAPFRGDVGRPRPLLPGERRLLERVEMKRH